jgi:hypothetical protein
MIEAAKAAWLRNGAERIVPASASAFRFVIGYLLVAR